MVTVPAPTPVKIPLAEPIEATPGLALAHIPPDGEYPSADVDPGQAVSIPLNEVKFTETVEVT